VVPETTGPMPAVVSAATPEPPAQASDDAGPTVTAAGPTSPDTDKPVVPTVRCTSQQRGRCDPQTVIG